MEATARAAAGGGGAAARGSRPSRGRAVATAAAAARKVEAEVEAEAAAQEEEEAEDGAGAARPRLQQEAMNGDRTESDWQGLVSEVRPRRRPGGKGRASGPQSRAVPPGMAEPGGDARTERGDVHRRPPRLALRVPPGALPLRSSALPGLARGHFPPRHLVTARGEGPSLRWAGPRIGAWSPDPGGRRGRQAPPAFLVATVLEPSDWTPGAEVGRWCQGNPGPGQPWARWHYLQWSFGWGSSGSSLASIRAPLH